MNALHNHISNLFKTNVGCKVAFCKRSTEWCRDKRK
jgi:hypothetical protein